MALGNPQWEDYDFVPFHRNRLAFHGDGWTEVEWNGGARGAYLDRVDYPPIPPLEEDKNISTVLNGTIDFGDAVTKDTDGGRTNGVNGVNSIPVGL
jgi:hypothetical protein